jgi:hypothetical protein
MSARREVSFLTFFLIWAGLQRWVVPLLHVRICEWLDVCDARVRVLMVFRGAAKSTIYAVYKAYLLYKDASRRSLIYAADDKLAGKLTRDTLAVLRRHPLCAGMLPSHPGALSFWVNGAGDARNPSMEAVGVNSNATGSRADDADFDDIEVPKNIRSPEARAGLRRKIDESTHILVPGGRKTFVGTPHTHDSVYDEQISGGAAALKIPLFESVVRYTETARRTRFRFDFPVGGDGLYVLAGISKFSRLMCEGRDYRVEGDELVFSAPPDTVLDICSGCAWPERFTREEIEARRRETRTLSAWDSQYQLEAKPLSELRLDPARIIPYDDAPEIRRANGRSALWLGETEIVGATAYWDCSLGKIRSDASAFSLILTDARGQLYWHVAEGLSGELAEFDSADRIVGGQVARVREIVTRFSIPRVVVETNGPGGFVPNILRQALKGTRCGVGEEFSTANKQKRILDAFEAPLSSRFLWAHADVLSGPVWDQMKDFDPQLRDQPDDYLDSAAGAILQTPVRIGRGAKPDVKMVGNPNTDLGDDDWRPAAGVYEVIVEY